MSVTWLSILISVRVSLSSSASTKAWTPEPVMKFDSKFKLCNVLFVRNMSLKAWKKKWEDRILKTSIYKVIWVQKSFRLTTATGSLLRVAAMLNFLTCVFFSIALAMSFSVGIGMFWGGEGGEIGSNLHTAYTYVTPAVHSVYILDGVHLLDLGVLCTLMLLRLTSVKEPSLFFILCRVSSTFVGLGGSSNTGFIFSPLITSTRKHMQKSGCRIQISQGTFRSFYADLLLKPSLAEVPSYVWLLVTRVWTPRMAANMNAAVSGWAAGSKRTKARSLKSEPWETASDSKKPCASQPVRVVTV